MDSTEKIRVREFYDSISDRYDEQLRDGMIANIIRKKFQKKLLENFNAGSRLLELGCGTGTDSIFLAKNDIYVYANDISPGMIKIAMGKIKNESLNSHIEFSVNDSENFIINSNDIYDGVISNFDCVNYLEISNINKNLKKITKQNTIIQFTVLNKRCLWELIYYLLKLHPLKAFRYFKKREKYFLNKLELRTPEKFFRNFSSSFRLKKITGVGLLIPPDGFKGLQKRFRALFGKLEKLDTFLASAFPFRNICDHYIIEMERIDNEIC